MAVLPVETWQQIVKDQLHTDDWLALSTTSSFFHSISQEVLYEDISIARTNGGDEDNEDNRKLQLFARSLKERPELAALVRCFDVCYYGEQYQVTPRNVDCYGNHPVLSNLHLFSTLTHLHVARFLIDSPFLSAIRSHPRLSHIEFTYCKVSEVISNSNVVIDNPESSSHQNSCAAVCPTSTRFLEFGPGDPMFVGQAFAALWPLGITRSLTRLSIDPSQYLPPNIVSILASCPQLRCLTLRSVHFSRNARAFHLDALTSDSIPLLEEFAGPAELLKKLIPGRPVHTVTVQFHYGIPVDILGVLQRSAVPVTKFIIAGRVEVLQRHHAYLMHLPTPVEYLGWEGFLDPERTTLYCPALSRLTSLAVVRGRTARNSENKTRTDLVRKFSKACPSIKEFDFSHERWLARPDGDWERYL